MNLARWKGKVALVTGGSSGIGESTARRLAREGLQVAICARREERLRDLAEEIGAFAVPADLRDARSIDALFGVLRERFGGVDVLVNNAGLGYDAPLVSGDTERWRETLEVNVLALCICTREAISDMRRRGDEGHVIHVSSMAAHRVPLGSGVYAASKYAVRALTEGLRAELRELGSAIRVSAISPGYVETEFAAVYHGSQDVARETYARFKVLEADDVADAIAYVLGAPPHMQVHDLLLRPTDQKT
jgi:17beta-estradiol 17-dehydrogenase / 3beta-hydroxysteroid 3-dehydrogenase